MEERFLLDWIDIDRDDFPVYQGIEFAFGVFSDAADPAPSGMDQTPVFAGDAANFAFLKFFIKLWIAKMRHEFSL